MNPACKCGDYPWDECTELNCLYKQIEVADNSKIEEIFKMSAETHMGYYNHEEFKNTHPTLLRSILWAMTLAKRKRVDYGFLVSIEGKETFIIAENIADACDRLEEYGYDSYSFIKHKSISII